MDGKLYATFDSFEFDPNPGPNFLVITTKVNPKLYRIDPSTGIATPVGHTDVELSASVEVDGKFYGFRGVLTGFAGGFPLSYSQLVTLDLTSGKVSFVRSIDPAAGVIFGAAPVRSHVGWEHSSSEPNQPGIRPDQESEFHSYLLILIQADRAANAEDVVQDGSARLFVLGFREIVRYRDYLPTGFLNKAL